jgi:hypothetical protein
MRLTAQVHNLVLDEARASLANGKTLSSFIAEAWEDERGLAVVDAQHPLAVANSSRAEGKTAAAKQPITDWRRLSKRALERLIAALTRATTVSRVVVRVTEETSARIPGVTTHGEAYLREHDVEEVMRVFEMPSMRLLVIETIGLGGKLRAATHYPVQGRLIMPAPLVIGRSVSSVDLGEKARLACLDAIDRQEKSRGFCGIRGQRIPPPAERH